MKVSVTNVKELQKHLEDLKLAIESLNEAADSWLTVQDERARWGSTDQYWAQLARGKLDKELDNFTEFLAWLYDFLHTERRAYEVPTGKYLQSLRDASAKESGEGSSEESDNQQSSLLS